MRKSIGSLFRFFNFFSLMGWIIFFSIFFSVRAIEGSLNRLEGLVDSNFSFSTFRGQPDINVITQLFVWASVIYLAVGIITVVITRLRFQFYIKNTKYKVSVEQGRVKLIFNKPFKSFPFYLNAVAVTTNLSAGSKLLRHENYLRGYLQDDELRMPYTDLHTGHYSIHEIKYYFKDVFGIFNARYYTELNSKIRFKAYAMAELMAKSIQTNLKFNSSIKSKLSKFANESFFATREYQRGDPMKRIHWKSTAKSGKLIVKVPEELEIDNDSLTIVLNLYFPKIGKIDQAEDVGLFLDYSLGFIKFLRLNSEKQINLQVITKTTRYIEDIQNFNSDLIIQKLLDVCYAQDVNEITQLRKPDFNENVILLSSSSSKITINNFDQKFILYLHKIKVKSFWENIKGYYFYKKENRYGFNFKDWWNNEPIKKGFSQQPVKNAQRKNERYYNSDKTVVRMSSLVKNMNEKD